MSKLPLLSWREVVKTLNKAGFQTARQKGSHLILVKNDMVVPVPKHSEIKRGYYSKSWPKPVNQGRILKIVGKDLSREKPYVVARALC